MTHHNASPELPAGLRERATGQAMSIAPNIACPCGKYGGLYKSPHA